MVCFWLVTRHLPLWWVLFSDVWRHNSIRLENSAPFREASFPRGGRGSHFPFSSSRFLSRRANQRLLTYIFMLCCFWKVPLSLRFIRHIRVKGFEIFWPHLLQRRGDLPENTRSETCLKLIKLKVEWTHRKVRHFVSFHGPWPLTLCFVRCIQWFFHFKKFNYKIILFRSSNSWGLHNIEIFPPHVSPWRKVKLKSEEKIHFCLSDDFGFYNL